MELESYKVGEYVTLTNQSTRKLQIGRIEDVNESEGTFTYIPFYKPEETHCGRLSYHGKNEVFKGNEKNQNREETLSNIIAKIEVLNPQDYSKVSQDNKFASDLYVCRQHYDLDDQIFFTPSEIEPDCFCNRILNPDDDLVLCECDRLFHYQCITSEQGTCPTCANNLSNLGDTLYKKRKLDDDKTILLKPDTEFYDIFANAIDDVVTDTTNRLQQSTSYSKSLNEKRPISALQTRKNPSNQLNIRAGTMTHAKKGQRRELTNINDDAYERVKHAIDVFSKAHQNKNLGDIERSRYIMKENYYKSLLYGVEEVKEKERLAGSHLLLTEQERIIAVKDTRQNYKNAENLAFNIEAIIWHTMNRNKSRIDPNYGMKNRELQSYLMDDNNFELRLSILTGDKKPDFLCQASGKELCSKNMSQKLEKKEMKTLQLSKISDEIKIVAKSHKGEVVIETNESTAHQISEPKKEPEPIVENNLETLTNLVHKIERKGSEGLSRRNSGRSMLMDGDDEEEDMEEFKLKKSKLSKSNSGEDSTLSENSGNRAADTLLRISNLGNNRLIDQDVLKNVTNFFFENTYSNIMERINNHLKPEIANKVSREINSKHKWN